MASRGANVRLTSTPSSPRQQKELSGSTTTASSSTIENHSPSYSPSHRRRATTTKDDDDSKKKHGNRSWLWSRRCIIILRSHSKFNMIRLFLGGICGCLIAIWVILQLLSLFRGYDDKTSSLSLSSLTAAEETTIKRQTNEKQQQQKITSSSLRSSSLSTTNNKNNAQPRYVSFFERDGGGNANNDNSDNDKKIFPTLQRLDLNMERYPSYRQMEDVTQDELDAQFNLQNSKDYDRGREDDFATEDCIPQYDWQVSSFPTCNTVHEFHIDEFHSPNKQNHDNEVGILTNGYWRDVWSVREQHSGTKRVLKTIRYQHDYTPRNYDRHRRDAVAMERLTSSPFVVDIYGFCGNSGLFDFSTGGDVTSAIWPKGYEIAENNLTNLQKLHIATQAAIGVAAMHNNIKEGQPSMAHTDITPGQFILIDGWYKLNDFNRVRFLRWNKDKNEACGYTVGRNPGKNRAPEEYAYESQSEKVDIYSLGNIFYMLLTTWWPFEDVSDKEAKNIVKDGGRPRIPKSIMDSKDPITQVLLEAMIMCHEQSQTERASARKVETFLMNKMKEIDPDTLAKWNKRYGSENLVIH